ncbi:MAG TPA: pyridoxamine 5'-phosphate oxidase family protein [Propionibacteriaceae bacterium]|nr:pyridoxamine 5'-phosphate oxidase family protein [Propionibacteriaceae bacterium]
MSSAQPERTATLTADMKRVVREQRLGFVATVCPDGTPNLSPKGTTRVWDDEHLVFCDLMSPQTVEDLRINPAVEVNVVDPIACRDIGSRDRHSPAPQRSPEWSGRLIPLD